MPDVPKHKQKAITAAYVGSAIADAIDAAILDQLPDDYEHLIAYSHRIRLCSQTANIWTATDLHTPSGECYDATGRFWNCSTKLCPHCLSKSARRNRQKLRQILENQRLMVGQNNYLLTLTMPNMGNSLLISRKLFDLAWSVFRKKKWFRETIIGGCKSEEFTLTEKGYHYHGHAIVTARKINEIDFRYHWTQSLRYAFAKTRLPLTIGTADELAIASKRKINSIRDAIQEVAKYITKTSSWTQIPPADLLDICRIRRFPRMFEFFGSFRTANQENELTDTTDAINKEGLDTRCVSDGENNSGWRQKVNEIGIETFLTEIHDHANECFLIRREQLKRHYPFATFRRLKPQKNDILADALRLLGKVLERKGDVYAKITPRHFYRPPTTVTLDTPTVTV